MSDPLVIRQQDAVLELTLNRPECRNALSATLVAALTDAVQMAASDTTVRCVLLTGTPPAFCAGLDLNEVAESAQTEAAHDTSALLALYEQLDHLPKPVIATVNGPAAAGGATLVTVSDVVVCAESARIGFPGIRHGLVAPIVMPYLVHTVGRRRARYLLLTGAMLDARAALQSGLVDEVVPDAEVLSRGRELATRLASYSPEALRRTKSLLRDARLGSPEFRPAAESVSLDCEARSRLQRVLDE